MLSKACEYAIRAMILIMTYSLEGKRIGGKAVAKEAELPGFFTANLLKDLTKAKLLTSAKGPGGGFMIPQDRHNMTLLDIIGAVDGNDFFTNCGLGLPNCSDRNPCPVHGTFVQTRESFRKMCANETLLDLATKLQEGVAVLTK